MFDKVTSDRSYLTAAPNAKQVEEIECEKLETRIAREKVETENLEKISGFLEELLGSDYASYLDDRDAHRSLMIAESQFRRIAKRKSKDLDSLIARLEKQQVK